MSTDPHRLLDLNTRYQSAWAEIHTRIEQRHSLFAFYSGLSVATVGLAADKGDDPRMIFLMSMVLTASTVVACLQLVMHELMIHNLHLFCRECEEQGARDHGPVYHCDPKRTHGLGEKTDFFSPARLARKINDCAWLAAFLATVLAGVYLAHTAKFPVGAMALFILPSVSLACVGATLAIIQSVRHSAGLIQSYDILKRLPVGCDNCRGCRTSEVEGGRSAV